ncbi:TniQ family protein [Flavobacterium oreochromis]|uniref:TniQ family protein n=1 Tax=Flavobacterium oreochromis TaxID=2906078 RepID=UPI00385ACBAB
MTIIYPNQKKIWPGYIPPEKNELFTSWLIRISKENLIKSHTFSNFYLERHTVWNRDIDKLFPDLITNKLLENTLLNYNEIKKLFLESYRDIIFNDRDLNSYTPGILNLGINHRKRKQFGLLCCPSCLNKEIPYFKKEWRLFFSIACVQCRCLLLDRCSKCEKPIAFHRLENGYKNDILKYPLYLCWNCFHDYREDIVYISKNSNVYKYQSYIDNTIKNEYNDLTQYSFLYFKVLHHLSNRLMCAGKTTSRIKLVVEKHLRYEYKDNQYEQNLSTRREILLISYSILNKFPNEFLKVFKNTNVRFSDLYKDIDCLPFWFEKEARNIR